MGNRNAFLENLGAFHADLSFLRVVDRNSAAVTAQDLGTQFSFCHIDGGHSDQETFADLTLCHQILLPGGLLALDDYFNPSFPGVCEGAVRFNLAHPGALKPLAIGFNKVLFQKPEPAVSLNGLFAKTFSQVPRDAAELWGVRVNVFWSRLSYFFDLPRSTVEALAPAGGMDLRATYQPETTAVKAARGERFSLPVRVTNTSKITFLCGYQTFGLSYHLLSSDGVSLRHDHDRNFFQEPLDPGDESLITLSIIAPDAPGNYLLEIDIVWEGVAWFKDKGNPTCMVGLEVE